MLSIEHGCTMAPDAHGLGRVPFVRRRLSISGIPLDTTEWPCAVIITPTDALPIDSERRFSWTHDLPDDWPDGDGPLDLGRLIAVSRRLNNTP